MRHENRDNFFFFSFGNQTCLYFAFTAVFLCVSDVWSETITISVLSLELIFNSFLNINLGLELLLSTRTAVLLTLIVSFQKHGNSVHG